MPDKSTTMITSQGLIVPLISVVICTYNRAGLLANILKNLCEQTLSPKHYEILIVDNNSNDNTREVTLQYSSHYPHVRYCYEPLQGQSKARNRGMQVAQGRYLAFCDDDCMIPEQWLALAKELIERISPAVFGGPFYPFYNTSKPRWYKDRYGSHTVGNAARELQANEFVYGGNMFFCREVLESLGGFDSNLGTNAKQLGFGEDVAPQLLMRDKMPEQIVYYDPRLYVYHLVRGEKMSLRWAMHDSFQRARYTCRLFHTHKSLPTRTQILRQTIYTFVGLFLDIVRGNVKRDRTQYPYIQNYLYENTLKYVGEFGHLFHQYCELSAGESDRSEF
jgi:glycosyltransferase involved in cell wall biosynthesis